MDKYPGCLGCLAGNCPAHREAALGEKCTRCAGQGFYMMPNLAGAFPRYKDSACPVCGGTGLIDKKKKTPAKRKKKQPMDLLGLMEKKKR
jgi:hypothetical protein